MKTHRIGFMLVFLLTLAGGGMAASQSSEPTHRFSRIVFFVH